MAKKSGSGERVNVHFNSTTPLVILLRKADMFSAILCHVMLTAFDQDLNDK